MLDEWGDRYSPFLPLLSLYYAQTRYCLFHMPCSIGRPFQVILFFYNARSHMHNTYIYAFQCEYSFIGNIHSGVYILQNSMARGGVMVPGKKMKNGAVINKMKKKEKGKRKKGIRKKRRKGKGESDFFLLILCTLLLIIVY